MTMTLDERGAHEAAVEQWAAEVAAAQAAEQAAADAAVAAHEAYVEAVAGGARAADVRGLAEAVAARLDDVADAVHRRLQASLAHVTAQMPTADAERDEAQLELGQARVAFAEAEDRLRRADADYRQAESRIAARSHAAQRLTAEIHAHREQVAKARRERAERMSHVLAEVLGTATALRSAT